MKTKLQPTKVVKILCPKCGELQMKIYPWSSYQMNGTPAICKRCLNAQNQPVIKQQAKTVAK